jgi:gamma-glutamyltranspeptidase/glutathione hydrolase
MCPVIARLSDGSRVALGASGGRRILPAVAQVLSFLADFTLDLEQAFHCPRVDVSGGPTATVDARLDRTTAEAVGRHLPVLRAETAAYPVPFASPSAVQRAGRENRGMADIGSPWSGAVAAS